MKALRYAAVFLLCLSLVGCATFRRQLETRREFESSIDDLCKWTGLERAGGILGVKQWPAPEIGCEVSVRLKVDGSSRLFIVSFDSHHRPLYFAPDPHDPADPHIMLGENTITDPKTRARCLPTIHRFSKHYHLIYYGQAGMNHEWRNFIITYLTVPPRVLKKHDDYLDPYVSFLVTPNGTLYCMFYGA